MSKSGAPKTIKCTAHCKDCGRETPNVSWFPGAMCPQCGSTHFAPVPVIRRGSDYEEADRSQGFAIEDIRLGRLAVWAGIISPKRFEQALHQQRQIAASQGKAPDLGTFLVERKDITLHQCKAILACLDVGLGNAADEDFVNAAAHQKIVQPTQIKRCRARQRALAEEGRDVPPLPLIMYETRVLQEAQIIAILRATEMHGRGWLYHINQAAEQRMKSRLKRWFGSRERPAVDPRLAILLGVLILAATVFGIRAAMRPAWAATECANCHALGGAPENSSWPMLCTECGMKEVYPRAVCEGCGEKFPAKITGYGLRCPNCGSSKITLITDKTKLKEPAAPSKTDRFDIDNLER